MKLDEPREKQIQQAIRRLLEMLGFVWYNLSQPRKTKQTPGLPDAIVFGKGRTIFVEVKRRPNKPTPDQLAFGECANESGAHWVCWFSVKDCADWLRSEGLANIFTGTAA